MENKKDVIMINNGEEFPISHNEISRKCIICGKMSKDGISEKRSYKMYGKFVCKSCIKSTANMYKKNGISVGFVRYLKSRMRKAIRKNGLIVVADCNKTKTRCKLCGEIIFGMDWKDHLIKRHGINGNVRAKDYFVKPSEYRNNSYKEWYDPDRKDTGNIPCGKVVNGAPAAKIIYTPVFLNKKKF